MDIYLLQSLCLVGLFLSMVTLTLLPSYFLRRRFARTESLPARFETLMGFANCVSGGVFLATFFVGLLPEVRREMMGVVTAARLTTSLPVTEVVVLLGFFMAMFVEQVALTMREPSSEHGHSHSPQLYVNESPTTEINGVATDTGDDRWNCYNDDDDDMVDEGDASFGGAALQADDDDDLVLPSPSGLDQGPSHHQHSGGGDHHGHSHNVEDLLVSTSRLRFGILLFSLGVHSLFEGMALGLQDEAHTLLNLFLGVWIHECLIAFALGFGMVKLRLSVCRLWQTAVAFASLIPFGQVLGLAIGSSRSWSGRVLGTVLQAVAAGTFIQVTFLDIIPDGLGGSDKTSHRLIKVLLLFLGFLAIAAITFAAEF